MKFKFIYFFLTKEERLEAMRARSRITTLFIDISIAIAIISTFFAGMVTQEKLQIPNAKETIGIIKEVNNKVWLKDKRGMGYVADFIVEYEVDGTKYVLDESVNIRDGEKNPKGKSIRGWEPEDKIKVIYNKENPRNAIVDKAQTVVIYTIIGIMIFVCLDIGIGKIREKKNKKTEKNWESRYRIICVEKRLIWN